MERRNKDLLRVEYSSTVALASYIVWSAIYGYFALRFDSDPEVCIASETKDVRIAKGTSSIAEDETDVGERFRNCFDVLFFLSAYLMTISLVISCIKNETFRKCLAIIGALAQYALTITVIVLFVSRFRHTGRVCSGDYLKEHDPEEGYLIQQGLFIKVVFIFFAVSLVVCCVCLCIGLTLF